MGGGLIEYRSALFASRGYASLSLAYIGHKDLPGPQNSMNVGDSYFKVRDEGGSAMSISFSITCPIKKKLMFTFIILSLTQNLQFVCLNSQHSSYLKIIFRSMAAESGLWVCPLESTWLFELPLTLVLKYVCLCNPIYSLINTYSSLYVSNQTCFIRMNRCFMSSNK